MSRALPIAFMAAATLALSACGDDEELTKSTTSATASAECEEVEAPSAKNVKLKPPKEQLKPADEITALVETSCGDFEIALDTERAPMTVSSFVHMAEEGVYDDTSFQRIVPGFVIQGGDPRGDGTGDAGYTVEETPPPDAVYTEGIVAMAKTGAEPPGTSGSQFFVVVTPDAGLPADYAVLGEVTSGDETVNAIAAQGDAVTEQPKQPVVIERISVK